MNEKYNEKLIINKILVGKIFLKIKQCKTKNK